MSSKLSTSIQRLSRNTASSIARMKSTVATGQEEQKKKKKENRPQSRRSIDISARKHPKMEISVTGQAQDFVGDFENQTDLQGKGLDGSSTGSHRSVCMACNRQIPRKSSSTSRWSQHENPQLLRSSPSSPIPTQCRPLKHSAEEEELEWESQFSALTDILIAHSETLERVSLDLLKSETRVTSLLVTEHNLEDKYIIQEHMYERALQEYSNTLKRQQALLENLDCIVRDIHSNQEPPDDAPTVGTRDNDAAKESSLATKLRWHIYQIIGGSAGTGQVMEDKTADKGDLIVSGTGVLLEQVTFPRERGKRWSMGITNWAVRVKKLLLFIQSLLLQKTPKYLEFSLYLDPATFQDKYQKKLQCNWVPDIEIAQCQYVLDAQTTQPQPCSVKFGWYRRRHHCRR